MWSYEKRLEYPINIVNPCPETAKLIISQFGGLNRKKIESLIEVSYTQCYI